MPRHPCAALAVLAAVLVGLLAGTGQVAPAQGPSTTTQPAGVQPVGEVSQAALTGLSIRSTASAPFALYPGLAGGAPRWNPCEDVPWAFNPAGAPAGGLVVVKAAVARISQVSGLRFRYTGLSRTVPTSSYTRQSPGAYKPILIGWSTAGRTDLLAGASTRTVGMTRIRWVGTLAPSGAVRSQIATAVVTFNAASRAPLWGARSRYTWALHELGHAVGLGHVTGTANLMASVVPSQLRDLGAGDRAGLMRVGARSGCLSPLR